MPLRSTLATPRILKRASRSKKKFCAGPQKTATKGNLAASKPAAGASRAKTRPNISDLLRVQF